MFLSKKANVDKFQKVLDIITPMPTNCDSQEISTKILHNKGVSLKK